MYCTLRMVENVHVRTLTPVQNHNDDVLLVPLVSVEDPHTRTHTHTHTHTHAHTHTHTHAQIAPPAEELFAIREPGQLTFDLSLMKSITVLFVDSICMHQFQGRHQFPGQLQALEVRRTIASLKVLSP